MLTILTAHALLSQNAFVGGPREAADDARLDLVEIFNSLRAVHDHVGSDAIGAETPDITSLGDILQDNF